MQIQAAVLDATGHARPYRSSRPLTTSLVELAAPGPDELLVEIDAAGLCHSDLSVVDGSRVRPRPMVLGHEATGLVRACGERVDDIELGDRVVLVFVPSCGLCASCTSGAPAHCAAAGRANTAGTLLSGARRLRRGDEELHHHLGVSAFATHAVVDRRSAVRVPAEVPAEVAALFGCAVLTGAGAVVTTAATRPGESVAVVGLGGVGLAAVLGAVLVGAHPVVAVDPVPEKRALARELGAAHAAAPEEAGEVLAALTGGGADVVVEAVGRAAALQTAWGLTGRAGRTVSVGLPDPTEAVSVPVTTLVGEGRVLAGSYLGGAVPQRDVPRYLALWRAGRFPVDRLLSGTVPLSDINEALDELASGRAVRQVLVP